MAPGSPGKLSEHKSPGKASDASEAKSPGKSTEQKPPGSPGKLKRKGSPTSGWPAAAAEGNRYICVIRHSQALHNVNNDNLWTPDNELTKQGEKMCEDARQDWGEAIFKEADLVISSPMMRALQTAYLISGKLSDKDCSKWMVTDMCAEHLSGATCDEGRPKSELVKAIPWMSKWQGVDKLDEEWWKAHREEEPLRAAAFLKFLADRPEKKIVIVSHGGFLQYISGYYMKNAEHFVMDINDCKKAKARNHTSTFNLNEALTKEYEEKSLKSLVDAPLDCLQGVGRKKAALIGKLGLKTVKALAAWRFARLAEALNVVAPVQHEGARDFSKASHHMNINKALDKEWEASSISDILEAPISAFQGLGPAADKIAQPLGLKTIKDLGTWKYFLWARAICTLAEFEAADGSS